nr:Mut7-C RNAse domain-containing protein [Candidatus Njordarchaeota archaeon]
MKKLNAPLFLVDQMLGELARWLRLLGYDTHYDKELTDNELVSRSKTENRILVTSDQELFRKAIKLGTRALLVKPDNLANRLAILAKTYDLELRLDPANSRCPICNGEIREHTDMNELRKNVPKKVLNENREFWVCNNCGKIYWIGGHWKNIARTIHKVRQILHEPYSQ